MLLSAILAISILGFSAWADQPPLLPETQHADRVVIEKGARRLTPYRGEQALASYPIALGFAPVGDKEREGDGRTPEGQYRIDRRNDKSAFHLSLGINYPTPTQRAEAKATGHDPGGDIFIHGQLNGSLCPLIAGDWTAGCAAVSNAEIEETWQRVPIGTLVDIRP